MGFTGRVAWALLLAALAGAPAEARGAGRPRIAVDAVRGDAGGVLAARLAGALCGRLECVPAARVRRGGKLDFRQAEAQGVGGIVVGSVARARGARRLEVALLVDSLRPRASWVVPLGARGRPDAAALEAVADAVQRELLPPVPAPPPAREPAATRGAPPPPPAARAPEPDLAPAASPAPARAAPAQAERAPAAAPSPPPVRRAAVPPREPRPAVAAAPERPRAALAALDLGVDLAQRRLTFDAGTRAAALQEFSADGVVSPALRLELSPFAGGDRWFAGLVVFGGYARSVGLETKEGGAGPARETTATRLEAGAGWRLRPLASARTTLVARASYRAVGLLVRPAIAGLPDAHLAGPSLGVDLDAPVGERFALLASLAYTRWTAAEDLVGPAYFGSGSAWAASAAAGISVAVRRPLSLRVLVEYERTRYDLSGGGGATDASLGGRIAARLEL